MIRRFLSRMAAHFVTPADAATVLSRHATTLAGKRAWVLADLKASVARQKAVQG